MVASDAVRVGVGAEGRKPAASPRVLVPLLVILAWSTVGCDSSSAPAASGTSAAADPAAAAEAMIQQDCSRCHAPLSIQGKTAADIRNASRTIPSMKRFDGQLTPAQLQALEQALAAPPGKR